MSIIFWRCPLSVYGGVVRALASPANGTYLSGHLGRVLNVRRQSWAKLLVIAKLSMVVWFHDGLQFDVGIPEGSGLTSLPQMDWCLVTASADAKGAELGI